MLSIDIDQFEITLETNEVLGSIAGAQSHVKVIEKKDDKNDDQNKESEKEPGKLLMQQVTINKQKYSILINDYHYFS